MKIQDTELEMNEADEVVLDYWLGGKGESKEEWAKRVWKLCNEYKETKGKGYPESCYGVKGMRRVYSRCPFELWEEKKRKRRLALYKVLHPSERKEINEKFLDCNVIKEEILTRSRPQYPAEISDHAIMSFKNHPKYTTRKEDDDATDKKNDDYEKEKKLSDNKKLAFYRKQGRSDEDIKLTHPELTGAL